MTAPSPKNAPGPRARLNIPFIVIFTILHVGAVLALIKYWSWTAFLTAGIGQIVFGWIGVGMGYHRLLTHASYKVKPWLERTLTTLGALALQGGPIAWVATHIEHHRQSDQPGDPHSPKQGGFWHAHLGWMVRGGQRPYGFRAIQRLKESRYYRFLDLGQVLLQFPLALILYLLGGWMLVFHGIFLRIVFTWHITFCVNSVCHMWGTRRYQTRDDSRNNVVIAVLAGGEGLHNNHHAEPRSASNRRGRWDFDPAWWMILGLEKTGLATDVVRPQAGA